jgi:hypothetical protein
VYYQHTFNAHFPVGWPDAENTLMSGGNPNATAS